MISTKSDNREEIFPLVDDSGAVIGSATRGECHSGSKLLHPVVHLQIFNSWGEIYLQRRPAWKDIQPNMWDTAVGGHVDYGESVEQALVREVSEELGIDLMEVESKPTFIASYIFESSVERELINSFMLTYDGAITPSEEVAEGRFWSVEEVVEAIQRGGVLTENFQNEFQELILNQPK